MKISEELAIQLNEWYSKHKRDLPWRDTGDPYDVWLSEIMLQQTRVEFVKERFIRFKQELPDIPSLAECEDDQLMKLWEGMGYYSRARNLKKCALTLVKEYDGKLPEDADELRKLPGIGPYTAGAISAIAYGHPSPAVDGNVLRVLARLFGDERDIRGNEIRSDLSSCIESLYRTSTRCSEPSFVRSFTQALMELGALVCVPNGAPLCKACPWKDACIAHRKETTETIPYRSPLKERRIEERTILVIRDGERFLLHKRPAKGLLAGLYEFPGIEGHGSRNEAREAAEAIGLSAVRIKELPSSKHIFSHVEWHMKAYEIQTGDMTGFEKDGYLLLTKKELHQFAVPSAFHAYKAYYELDD